MRNLSLLEFMAVLFAALAGVATAIQAYVSWETRGEVSRAIIFSERIEACADVLSAVDPLTSRATPEYLKRLERSERAGFNPVIFFDPMFSAPANGGRRIYDELIDEWRRASAAFRIVAPEDMHPRIDFFDKMVRVEMAQYEVRPKTEFISWLRRIGVEAKGLATACRNFD